ncbi:MAG: DEAD/DEAH box helicase [Saprospiraceae bacterium]
MSNTEAFIYKNYELLNPFQQKIVQLFALSAEAMHLNQAYNIVSRLRLRPEHGVLSSRTLEINLLELLNLQLLLPKGKSKFLINPIIENKAVRDVYGSNVFENYTRVLNQFFPLDTYSYWQTPPLERYYANIRIALLRNNTALVSSLVRSAQVKYEETFEVSKAYGILFNPFDEKWLLKLSDSLIHSLFMGALDDLKERFIINNDFFNFVERYKLNTKNEYEENFRAGLKWKYCFEGKIDKFKWLNDKENPQSSIFNSFKTLVEFMQGNYDLETLVDLTNQSYKKENRKRNGFAPYLSTQFGYLAYLSQNLDGQTKIGKYLKGTKSTYFLLSNTLAMLALAQRNEMNGVQDIWKNQSDQGLGLIFVSYANYWIYRDDANLDYKSLEVYYQRAKESKLTYIALLISDLFLKFHQNENDVELVKHYQEEQTALKFKMPKFVSIIDLMPVVEPWERAMSALLDLSNQFETNQEFQVVGDKRLIWLIDFNKKEVEPKEQKLSKNGKWSKGRAISFDRIRSILQYGTDDDFFSTKDKAVIAAINDYYNATVFELNQEMVYALVDHPFLFLNNRQRTAVEIILEKPQLILDEDGDNYELKFNIPIEFSGMKLVKETPTRYKAVEISEEHLKIAKTLGQKALKIPKTSEEQIAKIVKGFSKVVNVQSTLVSDDVGVTNVEADAKPHIHLLPLGDGFQLEIYVKPLGEHPPYFKPGEGGAVIITEKNAIRYQTERDLKLEKKLAKEVVKACSSLGNARKLSKIWEFETAEECLEILTELQPLKEEEKIILEWPKGERLKLKGTASIDNFAMEIKGSTDWFEAKGTLKVGEDLVMGMKEILGLLKQNSRFIQLKNGEFLALTNRFKKQLEAMEAYGDMTKDGVRFHPLAAYAFEDIGSEAQELNADAAFLAQIKKLKDAEKKKPKLPSTFKAELRDYQKEGYNWLMKLANWDVGACLADDMGLGKTVQALAAILTRAKSGPTLVVCPASVRTNWEREAQKFAPKLNPIQFGYGDRAAILKELGKYDVLITSYGLMQTEAENLTEIEFSTIVLDEAQAIKNRTAKRSKAAMELKAGFKIITTGTPIENHLGELWNLFRFINPGLLGSLDRFRERFALPISKYGDEVRQEQLKKLIRPFILRRRKSEVLKELPEKTEVVLSVTMSPAEKAFYEALRQSAVEKLAETDPSQGGTHLKILAEITRLRQACCNPKLVQADVNIESAKLALFNETIDELIENGHKVLVFSQFVKHLRILESSLQKKKINYQYLDGSTSRKKRQIAIDAFQEGEGDVFLISLKAGGVGLNLTAADYVIHMDPWWNPAVEDQASDRAHRIGQKRPVTIYRLVTEGTIEEKIVQLHSQKRDLADSLLSGTNKGNKMSADDLMNLIKEGMRN